MLNKRNIVLISAIIFLTAGTAFAAEFAAPKRDGDPNITLSASQTYRNLYAVGANVIVNGAIGGDLFAAGGMVSVIGDVEEDLNVAGGSLSLNGKIGGDARVVGGNVTISSPIEGDLFIAGGNVSITEKSSIHGDLIIGGGNIVIAAPVRGNLKAAAESLTINSKVEGDINVISTGKRQNQGLLIFGPKAEVGGKIEHRGSKQAIIKEGAQISEIIFTPKAKKSGKSAVLAGLFGLGLVFKIIAGFLAALALLKYRQNGLQRVSSYIKEKPWENLLLGLAGIILIPILAILALFTIIGY